MNSANTWPSATLQSARSNDLTGRALRGAAFFYWYIEPPHTSRAGLDGIKNDLLFNEIRGGRGWDRTSDPYDVNVQGAEEMAENQGSRAVARGTGRRVLPSCSRFRGSHYHCTVCKMTDFYATAELAREWGCSERHIRNLIKSGQLHAIRLGGRTFRVPASAVRDVMIAEPPPRSANGRIYFIECGDFIKIGYSLNPEARLRQIQAAMPLRATLLVSIAGNHRRERDLHAKFRHLLEHNEWFRKSQDLLDHIREVSAHASHGASQ